MADYDIGNAFSAIENELIASMIRNLERHKAEEIAEGMNWSQWQVEQLNALDEYKRRNAKKYGTRFSSINDKIEEMLTGSYNDGATKQERDILRSIKKGLTADNSAVPFDGNRTLTGEFFKTNDRKLDALIKATTDDMKRAETAVLRMTNDKYRKIIFNAQVYANTGAGTYEKAVDMATKDFLSAGINCIEYKNGRRVNIKSYAEMAIRTANKRAYLQGEGEMRKKWGIHTVILNKRSNACPKCIPFVGRVIVDDVWSGGTSDEASEKGYLLMSDCIRQGLYHPNCKDSHTTYFGDILDDEDEEEEDEKEEKREQEKEKEPEKTAKDEPQQDKSKPDEGVKNYPAKPKEFPTKPEPVTPKEQKQCEDLYNAEQYQQYAERQAEKWDRMSEYSLDKDNKRIYGSRADEWRDKADVWSDEVERLKKTVEKSSDSGIIELYRNKGKSAPSDRYISDRRFAELTIEARLLGAEIIRDEPWFNERMASQNASAITYGEVLAFGANATVSDVIEETYHYKQNLQGMNADKPHDLRIILNEIDAKQYLIDNAKKFKIPRTETELTKKQLEYYKKQLKEWNERSK